MTNEKYTFSIVIPVYNSEKTLNELVLRIQNVMNKTDVGSFEIILVDDCSRDNSWQELCGIYKENDNIKIIHLLRNFGQHNATLCGFKQCCGKYIITLDDDLQHPPEEIPKLINKIYEGYLVVYGKYKPLNETFLQKHLSRLFQRIMRMSFDIPTSIFLSSFAIYDCSIVNNMTSLNCAHPFLFGLVIKSAPINKIKIVDVKHNMREVGKSNYGLIKYLKYSLNLIINYSSLPLTLIAAFGTIISLASICYGLFVIIKSFLDPTYGLIGWNSTMVAITLLGGIILLSLGIIGEYLRRILTEVSYGQQYAIAEMYL